jgi:hypothetical protein
MKKRTVITTEKREVWVIRTPAGKTKERETDVTEAESSVDSLIAPRNQGNETDLPQESESSADNS